MFTSKYNVHSIVQCLPKYHICVKSTTLVRGPCILSAMFAKVLYMLKYHVGIKCTVITKIQQPQQGTLLAKVAFEPNVLSLLKRHVDIERTMLTKVLHTLKE